MEKKNVVLTGKDVYAQIVKIDENPLLDKNGIQYKRYSYQAIAFIMREPAYRCFDSGDMSSLTLVPTQREQDVLIGDQPTGQTMVRDGWSYGGHLTHEQELKLEVHDARLKAVHNSEGRIINDPNIPVAGTVLGAPIQALGYPLKRPQDFPDLTENKGGDREGHTGGVANNAAAR